MASYDTDWLERMYNNRARVPGYAMHFKRWADTSAAARDALAPQQHIEYGQGRNESLDIFNACGEEFRVAYDPAEGTSGLFGGNSNWRGPIWFPLNYLLIESLEKFDHFYGDTFKVECPVGSGTMLTLAEVARELSSRLTRLFLPDANGRRPVHGDETRYTDDAAWRELVLFYEYFHADTGRGVGASHQTGWTALVTRCLESVAKARDAHASGANHEHAHGHAHAAAHAFDASRAPASTTPPHIKAGI